MPPALIVNPTSFIVIPAKAGISTVRRNADGETPAFAGVTGKSGGGVMTDRGTAR